MKTLGKQAITKLEATGCQGGAWARASTHRARKGGAREGSGHGGTGGGLGGGAGASSARISVLRR